MSLIFTDEPGPVSLSPTRFAYNTGKVLIGIRHEPRYVEHGSHALMWQTMLTTALPPEAPIWPARPAPIDLKPSLRKRVVLLLRGFK